MHEEGVMADEANFCPNGKREQANRGLSNVITVTNPYGGIKVTPNEVLR